MNKIDYIKKEFSSQFEDVWKERFNQEEGCVQHSKWGGLQTHCRSTMYTLVKMLKPLHILEIGSWRFDASEMMALAMDEYDISKEGQIHSFDICEGGYSGGKFLPKNPRIKPHYWRPHHTNYDQWKYSNTTLAHPDFKFMSNEDIFKYNKNHLLSITPKEKFSLILIDGDHSYDGVKWDWEYAKLVAAPNAVICIDDLADDRHYQVRKFWDELPEPKYDFTDWNEARPDLLSSVGVTQIV